MADLPQPKLLYLDTSVLGAIADDELPDRVGATMEPFALIRLGRFIAATSAVTAAEIRAAPSFVVDRINMHRDVVGDRVWEVSDEARHVADTLLALGVVPSRFANDALHLGVAIVNRAWAVVSWNFKHMVNVVSRRKVRAVCELIGLPAVEILSPPEVVADVGP